MAGYPPARNPFLDDDEEIDDDAFLNRKRNGYILNPSQNDASGWANPQPISIEEKRQELLQKQREFEKRSIQSTERSLGCLRNSEEVGAATAEELYRQREQLERTDKRLDDINNTLRFSQRHIQGIKSVFGGLKNFISRKAGAVPTASTAQSNLFQPESNTVPSSSNLYEVIDRNKAQKKMVENASLHPGLKIRGIYEAEENTVLESSSQDVIDKNLDHMLSNISRLKDLSYHLGDEIESQNDLIERVMDKTERADTSTQKQNKDMNKLLK